MLYRLLIVCFISCCMVGCQPANNPGTWDQAKLEAHIKETMQLSEISLQSGAGGFSGTGKSPDGESFKLEVNQNAATKSMSWKYTGDRGTIGDNKYELVNAK